MPKIVDDSVGPVGSIISSMLSLAQFQSINGTGWVLMDGGQGDGSGTGTIPVNCAYRLITGATTVPDARGMVLRGLNNGRADGNQDPQAGRTAGSMQQQATAKNGLTASSSTLTGGVVWKDSMGGLAVWENPTGVFSSTGGNIARPIRGSITGGADYLPSTLTFSATPAITVNNSATPSEQETRMRNIAVNYFIRIN